MSEKHENFVRLAEARLDSITDAMRIFSNLSGPSYEWSTEEVLAYFARIDEAKEKALARFRENKKWIEPDKAVASTAGEQLAPSFAEPEASSASTLQEPQADSTTEASAEPEAEDGAPGAGAVEPEAEVRSSRSDRRAFTVGQLMKQVEKAGPEMLAEMVAMQREVIDGLQSQLDARRRIHHETA